MRVADCAARVRNWLARPDLPWWILLVAVLLALPSVPSGLSADDHHFRMVLQGFPGLPEFSPAPLDMFKFADGDQERNAAYMERGLLPWWATPELRLAFWRPLAAVTHWLDFVLWRDNSILIHLQSIAWYGLLAFTVTVAYRRFFAVAWVAGLAALLFAIDDAHAFPVGWNATRNTVMSCIAILVVLVVHDRWRRNGWKPGRFLGPFALAVGLLSGEAAVGGCGYLFAYATFIDRGSRSRRLGSLAPYAVVAVVWWLIYKSMGYGAVGSGVYLDPATTPGLFLRAASQHLPLLLFGQFAGVHPGLWTINPAVWKAVHLWSALGFAALTFWTLWPLFRRDRWARFWALGMILSMVPACAVAPQNRVLYIPGIGGMALIALLIHAWTTKPEWLAQGSPWRLPVRAMVGLWIVVHLFLAPLGNLPSGLAMALLDHRMNRIADSIPRDPSVAEADVIVVSLPTDIFLHAIPYIRSSLRWPSPRRLQALHAGFGSVAVRRTDERTLVVEPEGTFVSRPWATMFRGPDAYPFAVGDVVRLQGLTIEVLAVDGRKRATRVEFRFDDPLERAATHWLTWSEGALVPFELPGIGEQVRLPEIELRQLLFQNTFHFFSTGAWKRMHEVETGPL